MKRDSVTYRLGTSGEGEVLQTLAKIGEAGEAGAKRAAKAWERDSRVAEAAIQRVERSAERLKVLGGSATARSIAESTGLAQSELGNTKSAEASMSVFIRQQDQLAQARQRLLAQSDPLFAAQQRYNSVMAEAVRLDRQGALAAGDLGRIHASAKADLDQFSTVMGGATKNANLQRMGFQQLSYQVADVGASYASGISPMIIFAQQGTQVVQSVALMSSGTSRLAAFLTGPWGLAVMGAVSVLGILATSYLQSEKAADKSADANGTLAEKLDLAKRSYDAVVKAAREYNDEAERSGQTAMQQAQAAMTVAHANYEAAKAIREKLRATYEEYQQAVRAGPTGPNGQGQIGAAAGASVLADLVSANDAAITEFEEAMRNTEFDFAKEWAKIQSDPVAKVTERFERMREELRGSGLDVDVLKRKLAELAEQEEAAKKAVRDAEGGRGTSPSNRASSVGDMTALLEQLFPGVRITSTTGGKHKKGSDHYAGRAIDFVVPGMLNAEGTKQVYEILRSAGIDIRRGSAGNEQFFGPGRGARTPNDHNDHFHLAWDGKAPDAYKARLDAEKALQEQFERNTDAARALVEAGDPYAAIANRLGDELAEIDRLAAAPPAQGGIGSEQADILRQQARDRATFARGDLFNSQNPGYLDAIEEADRRYADQQRTIREIEQDQRRIVASLDIEARYIGRPTAERDRQLALQQFANDLADQGVDLASEQAQELIRGNAALYERGEALRRSQEVLDEQRRIGEAIIDDLFDPQNWDDWGAMGKRILQMLVQEMLVLAAVNPLKNTLFGSDLPTLGSSGGLFGFLGGIFGNAIGTEYSEGGWRRVGEFGEELVKLPRGAQVLNASRTRAMQGDRSPTVVQFDLRGAVMTEQLLQQMQDMANSAADDGARRGARDGATAVFKAHKDTHGMVWQN